MRKNKKKKRKGSSFSQSPRLQVEKKTVISTVFGISIMPGKCLHFSTLDSVSRYIRQTMFIISGKNAFSFVLDVYVRSFCTFHMFGRGEKQRS